MPNTCYRAVAIAIGRLTKHFCYIPLHECSSVLPSFSKCLLTVTGSRESPIYSLWRTLWSLLPVSRLCLNQLELLITNLIFHILQHPTVCCNSCYTFWDSMYRNFFSSPGGSKPETYPCAEMSLNVVHTTFFVFVFLSSFYS